MTMLNPTVIDYRGKRDNGVLDELRELTLTKQEDVYLVEVMVDSEKFAKKIMTFATIAKCHAEKREKDGYWSVLVSPPACEPVTEGCSCSI